MATIGELELRLIAVEEEITDAVTIPDFVKEANDPSITVGDIILGIKAGINAGAFFIGTVLAAPPVSDTDLTIHYP